MTTIKPVSDIGDDFIELTGVAGNSAPFLLFDSSSRLQMMASHIGQAPPISGGTPRRIQTGAESDMGKYVFNIKMPCDGKVIKVLRKYPQQMGAGGVKRNSISYLIYENMEHPYREIGVLELPQFFSNHPIFGFEYKPTSAYHNIRNDMIIPKGTVLMDSPSIKHNGEYCYGVEANVAYMSVPEIIEDGFVVSESFLKKIQTLQVDSRTASWGKEYYPINLYGDENEYKPFPEIGQAVREDGLLFALRRYNAEMGVLDMSTNCLMEPDYSYDKAYFAEPGSIVHDVTVHRGNSRSTNTPVGMETMTERYVNSSTLFYRELLEIYHRLAKQRGKDLVLHPALHRLVVLAYDNDPADYEKARAAQWKSSPRHEAPLNVHRVYRRQPLDEWRVHIDLHRAIVPNTAYKLSDNHGAKGVNIIH